MLEFNYTSRATVLLIKNKVVEVNIIPYLVKEKNKMVK
jgi:hypothetical protein